jgi:molybdopterin-synthase adenylyltransferase
MENVETTYDAFAPYYDNFTSDHNYEAWGATLDALLARHGRTGKRLLDVACGTGKSFEPFLTRGFSVTGCDISAGMLAQARKRATPGVRLVHADARRLPALGEFDVALCLDDALNYVLEPGDLVEVFGSVANLLAAGGLFLFDVNTLGAYRSIFATDRCRETEDELFVWRGEVGTELHAGSLAAATIEVFRMGADGVWVRTSTRHVERHHPADAIVGALAAAGLELRGEYGLTPDGRLHDDVDELAHTKRVYVVALGGTEIGKEVRRAEDREARGAHRPGSRHHEVKLNGKLNAPAPAVPGRFARRVDPVRPRLKPTIDVFEDDEGRIHLYRGGSDDYVIDPEGRPVAALLDALDGSRSVEGLRAALERNGVRLTRAELRDSVHQLLGLGLLDDAADDDCLGSGLRRYDRQLRYFGDIAAPSTPRATYQRRLQSARVVMLGLGGLGGWAAYALASAGVGTLVAVDGDVVEWSNLNRQILYGECDIGKPKAEAAARALGAFNSAIRIEPIARMLGSAREVEEVVAGADFVVDAADQPVHEIERWVNAACFRARIPYVMMSQFPPLARLGPTYIPGRTGCYACQEARWRERFPLFDALAEHRRRRPCPAGSFGPACGLIGSQVAMDVVHYLSGICDPATLGASLTVDLRTMAIRRERVQAIPDCEVCGAGSVNPVRPAA